MIAFCLMDTLYASVAHGYGVAPYVVKSGMRAICRHVTTRPPLTMPTIPRPPRYIIVTERMMS